MPGIVVLRADNTIESVTPEAEDWIAQLAETFMDGCRRPSTTSRTPLVPPLRACPCPAPPAGASGCRRAPGC